MCPSLNQSLWLGESGALIGQAWVMCLLLNQSLWVEMKLLLARPGSCAHAEARSQISPWIWSQEGVVPQRKARGFDFWTGRSNRHCSLRTLTRSSLFLVGFGCLGHGCNAVLLCVRPGNGVGCPVCWVLLGSSLGLIVTLAGDSTYSLSLSFYCHS